MKNLVALVTGGASGLGKSSAQYLAKRGAKVALIDLPKSNGALVAANINKECLFIPSDVTVESDVEQALQLLQQKFGRLDVVVNCAGISCNWKIFSFKKSDSVDKKSVRNLFEKILKTDPYGWSATSKIKAVKNVFNQNSEWVGELVEAGGWAGERVNVHGSLNVINHAVRLISRNEPNSSGNRGVVINTTSFSSFEPQFGQVLDAHASGAINCVTKALARDYLNDGIRFVAIAPGLFQTSLITSSLTEQNLKYYEKMVPFPSRLGSPEEFAALVYHTIENQTINGEVIRLSGALRMNL